MPTRRAFDTTDQLEDRMRRADAAFGMAYDLGTKLVLARAGALPPADEAQRRETFTNALRELGGRAGMSLGSSAWPWRPRGPEPGAELNNFLRRWARPAWLHSHPASGLAASIDPVRCVRELGSWVVHAYAGEATGSAGVAGPNPRGFGFAAGALDWEAYLGAFEEIGYTGFLTIWPGTGSSAAEQFTAVRDRLAQLS